VFGFTAAWLPAGTNFIGAVVILPGPLKYSNAPKTISITTANIPISSLSILQKLKGEKSFLETYLKLYKSEYHNYYKYNSNGAYFFLVHKNIFEG